MKKFIYMMAGVALAASMSACADTEKPVYHEPSADSFKVHTPPLQNEYLATTDDKDNKSTFSLTCSGQADYGVATQCVYGAQVSLTNEFTDEIRDEADNVVTPATYKSIDNQDANNPAMSLRTYDLALAMCNLLGIDSPEAWDEYIANGGATEGLTVYFRATCQIPGVPSSLVASSNSVSYTNVQLSFAVPVAGVIYICGDCNGFTEPSAANATFYKDWQLIEPEDAIGARIYAGSFLMPDTESVHAGASGNDYNTQWRFFTELSGWGDGSKMVGSNEADFYVEPITGGFSDGMNPGSFYTGNAVYGKGNWGVLLDVPTQMTIAVSLVDKNKPKVYFKVGNWNVTVAPDATGINEPVFTAISE
ncbi:MAG: hypothetical protein NC418_01145 [Muribaculaceae bacterium]|nr:hypothetical protein [Muribaculaceae bacterium]